MTAATVVVTVLAAFIFGAAAWTKFTDHEIATSTRDRLGISPGRYRLIGVAEAAGVVGALIGLAYPPVGIAALAGLVLVGIAACAVQVKLHNPMSEARVAITALVLATAALILQVASA